MVVFGESEWMKILVKQSLANKNISQNFVKL